MVALLEKSGVIDDPGLDRLPLLHGLHYVIRRLAPHGLIAPLGVQCEVEESLMKSVGLLGICAGACGDGFYALAVSITHQPHCIHRKGATSAVVTEHITYLCEVLLDPLHRIRVCIVGHGATQITRPRSKQAAQTYSPHK